MSVLILPENMKSVLAKNLIEKVKEETLWVCEERMLYNGQVLPCCQSPDLLVLRTTTCGTPRCGTAVVYLQIPALVVASALMRIFLQPNGH